MKLKILLLTLAAAVAIFIYTRKKPNPPPIMSLPTITSIAAHLETPWSIVFLPSGEMVVSQRPGKIIKVNLQTHSTQSITGLDATVQTAEGGLLGMTLHPQFSTNQFIYIYQTVKSPAGLQNQVNRYRLTNNELVDKTLILGTIKAAQFHDGGDLAFGPDGYLYITTGDAQDESLAQNSNSLNGKILRLRDDGSLPPDNPFHNPIYAYGFRNPQGLAWDDHQNLWAVDHGPSGSQTGYDEINLVEKGKNYGWPVIRGDQTHTGMESPQLQSGSGDTWAPSSLIYFHGSLYFTGLRGEAIYQAPLQNNKIVTLKSYFKHTFGRLRSLRIGPDNYFYVATSNRDGRGTPHLNDDQILRLIF